MAKKKIKRNKTPPIKTVTKTGRKPIFDERMPARTINMPDSMYVRLGEEAEFRNLSGGHSEMARTIFGWFFDALDRQRGGTEDKKIFDEVLASGK